MLIKLRLILLSLVIGSINAAWAQNAPSLKIGVVLPLSGPQANFGEGSLNAIEQALEKLKTSDPDLAKRITIVKEDDKSNPIDAATAAKKLLNVDKVDIILGSIASSNTLAMAPSVITAGKPLVTHASTNPEVTQKSDLVFRTCFMESFQGGIIANYALNHLKKKKAAILFDHKSDYSRGFVEFFEKTFKAGGGQIVGSEAYEAGKKDFKVQLSKLRAKQPEVLLIPGYFQEVGLIMKQAYSMGFKVTMLGGDAWGDPNLYELAGPEAVRGHYFVSHFSTEDTDPAVQAFLKTYSEKFKKEPNQTAALAYDGLLVVADAFKRAGSNNPQSLKKALSETKSFKGVSGTITINAHRDAEKAAVILKTEDNKAVFVTKIAPESIK